MRLRASRGHVMAGVSHLAAKAFGWTIGVRGALFLLSFGQKIVLARFLAPADFGKVAMALVTVSILEAMSQTGYLQALIHKRKVTEADLDTVWCVSVLRGVVLASISFVLAEPIAAFFREPAAADFQRLLSVVFLFNAAINPAMALLQKELAFARVVAQQGVGTVLEAVVAVGLAIALRDPIALVVGVIVRSAASCALSFVVAPYSPRLRFDFSVARSLFKYGRWITGANILNFAAMQGDNAVVGRVLGASSLGLYSIAYNLSTVPSRLISTAVGQVSFPAYVQVRDTRRSLATGYLSVVRYVALVSLPLSVGMIVTAPLFVPVVLGPRWIPMVAALQILCVVGILRSLGANAGALYQAIGKPELALRTSAIRLVLLVALIVPATSSYGIVGTAWAVLASTLIPAPYAYYLAIRSSQCGLRAFSKTLAAPVVNTAIMVGTVLIVHAALAPLSDSWLLLFEVVAGAVSYAAATAAWLYSDRFEDGRTAKRQLRAIVRRQPVSPATS